MGGSSGGGYVGGAESRAHDCMSVRFVTNLEPVADATLHSPPARLWVLRISEGGHTAFVAADENGRPVGTIVDRVDDLLRCTDEGFSFVADVTKVSNRIHTVRVQPDPGSNA